MTTEKDRKLLKYTLSQINNIVIKDSDKKINRLEYKT